MFIKLLYDFPLKFRNVVVKCCAALIRHSKFRVKFCLIFVRSCTARHSPHSSRKVPPRNRGASPSPHTPQQDPTTPAPGVGGPAKAPTRPRTAPARPPKPPGRAGFHPQGPETTTHGPARRSNAHPRGPATLARGRPRHPGTPTSAPREKKTRRQQQLATQRLERSCSSSSTWGGTWQRTFVQMGARRSKGSRILTRPVG